MFGLEVHSVPFTVKFPLTLPVGQHPKDLGIVEMLMEPIIGLRVNQFYVIVAIDRLLIELSYHTCGSWARRLAKCPPSLVRNGFVKEIIGVVKPLLLDEGLVL